MSGSRPFPLAHSSLTMIDDDTAVLFGGYGPSIIYSSVTYTLNLKEKVLAFTTVDLGKFERCLKISE